LCCGRDEGAWREEETDGEKVEGKLVGAMDWKEARVAEWKTSLRRVQGRVEEGRRKLELW
jgi:hypothetical protein